MYYRAPWGRFLIVISATVSALLGGMTVAGAVLLAMHQPVGLALLFVPLVVLVCSVPFAILGYSLEGSELLVRRLGWHSRVSVEGLREIIIDPKAMRKSLRLFGNGGLFAFAGWFWNRRIGRYRAFATDFKRAVVLKFPQRTIVITPEKPEEFVKALSERLPHLPDGKRT
jgi:hypothetical protein